MISADVTRLMRQGHGGEEAELRLGSKDVGDVSADALPRRQEAITRCRDIGHEHREQSEQARRHCSTMCVRKKQHEKLP